jgi:ribonuclease Z
VRAFPTIHRINSQGYILYKTVKKLKPEYVGQPSAAIAELNRSKADIFDIICTPEVAYTGKNRT